MNQITYLFSKIEILHKVSTVDSTRGKITEYQNIKYSFYKYVLSLGNKQKDQFPNGFSIEEQI